MPALPFLRVQGTAMQFVSFVLLQLLLLTGHALAETMDLEWCHPRPSGNALFYLTNKEGITVAAGDSDTLVRTLNGTDWQLCNLGKNRSRILALGTCKAGFVAYKATDVITANNGLTTDSVLTSTDGLSWKTSYEVAEPWLRPVKIASYGDSVFFAGSTGKLMITDTAMSKVSFQQIPLPKNFFVTDFVAGPTNLAYASSSSGTVIFSSTDNITWTVQKEYGSVVQGEMQLIRQVWKLDNLYLASGTKNSSGYGTSCVGYSQDGITWTPAAMNTSYLATVVNIFAKGATFYMLTNEKSIHSSTDGKSWQTLSYGPSNNRSTAAVFDGSRLISIDHQIITSTTDFLTWSTQTGGFEDGYLYSMTGAARKPGLWMAAGYYINSIASSGLIMTSVDGSYWSKQPLPSKWNLPVDCVIWDGKRFLVWTGGRYLLSTQDGKTWVQIFENTSNGLVRDMHYNGKLYVAVGTNGLVITSLNGSTWAVPKGLTTGGSHTYWKVASNGTSWLALGDSGAWRNQYQASSVDGDTWVEVGGSGGGRSSCVGICWNGYAYVTFSDAGSGYKRVLYHNGVYFGIKDKQLFYSYDAVTWLEIETGFSGYRDYANVGLAFTGLAAGEESLLVLGEQLSILRLRGLNLKSDQGPLAEQTQLTNMSVRSAFTDAQTLIVGFVAEQSTELVARFVGPGLAEFGFKDNHVQDPRLGLYSDGKEVASNDDWSSELASDFSRLGAFGLGVGSKDAAMKLRVTGPNSIWALAKKKGVGLMELYDTGQAKEGRLKNVSARNYMTSGEGSLVAGFVLSGTRPRRVLIRAVGPSLAAFGVTDYSLDPVLSIYKGQELIATNDNHSATLQSIYTKVGAFTLKSSYSADAALCVVLPPGAYTAMASEKNGRLGNCIIEVYDVNP